MSHYKNKTCAVCGIPIHDRAKKYCGKHRGFDRARPTDYVCPICGGPKSRIESKVCSNCYDPSTNSHTTPGWKPFSYPTPLVNFDNITPEWAYQFVGLFHSEGFAILKRTKNGAVHSTLGIGLRVDDDKVLYDVQSKLGGILRVEHRPKTIMFRWHVTRVHEVKAICELIIQYTLIPFKKLRDVELVLQFTNWRLGYPFHNVPDWSEAQRLHEELRSIRVFKLHG